MRTDDPWTCLLPDGGTIRDPSAPDAARDTGTGDADAVDTGVDANPIDPVDADDASPADSGCSFEPFCREDTLVSCRVGSVEEDDCALGCDAAAGRCRRLVPSNLPEDTCDRAARAFELVVASGTERVIDTSTDCELVVPQVGGPELCVHWGRRVVIEEGATLRGEASDPDQNRALVLVAGVEFVVDGSVSVSAGELGVEAAGAAQAPSSTNSSADSVPPPGGSFGERAGAGGSGGVPVAPARGTNALAPLLGGIAGGGFSVSAALSNRGGGGGGALQLVGCRSIVVRGVLEAVGGGGRTRVGAGTGGGSGGGILLETGSIALAGVVSANGGGGAGGNRGTQPFIDTRGDRGTLSLAPATGGNGLTGCGGNGGSADAAAGAGRLDVAPGAGRTCGGGATSNWGAGGGSVGRIRINTPTPPDLTAATISPAPTLGVVEAR
jgi:hypothetical protein